MRKHPIERLCRDTIRLRPRGVVNPDATSPYQRYGKAPYQYSAELRQWERRMGAKHQKDNDNGRDNHAS